MNPETSGTKEGGCLVLMLMLVGGLSLAMLVGGILHDYRYRNTGLPIEIYRVCEQRTRIEKNLTAGTEQEVTTVYLRNGRNQDFKFYLAKPLPPNTLFAKPKNGILVPVIGTIQSQQTQFLPADPPDVHSL